MYIKLNVGSIDSSDLFEQVSDPRTLIRKHYHLIEGHKTNVLLPEISLKYNREYSFNEYRYNPHKVTCTCDEHRNAVALYGEKDVRTVCKHLSFKLQSIDELYLLLINYSLLNPDTLFIKRDWLGKEVIIAFEPIPYPQDVELFYLHNGEYKQVNYHLYNKYLFNEHPEITKELINELHSSFQTQNYSPAYCFRDCNSDSIFDKLLLDKQQNRERRAGGDDRESGRNNLLRRGG